MNQSPTVIFIAAQGRSGSTLLDLLISAHSQVFSVGEVIHMRDFALGLDRPDERVYIKRRDCTCGAETIFDCPFWSRVNQTLQEDNNISCTDFDMRDLTPQRVRTHNTALFNAITKVSGKRFIVDSSKAPQRLAALQNHTDLNILPIYLVRSPGGTIYSHMKRGVPMPKMWVHFSYRTALILKSLRNRRHAVLHYDYLTNHPREAMQQVMEYIGLPFEEQQLQWAGRERHNMGGNPMRWSTDSTIIPDNKWKTELPAWKRAAISIATAPVMSMVSRRPFVVHNDDKQSS